MGNYAAINIYQQLLEKTGKKPEFVALNEYPAMIALAVGKQAVLYGPDEGTTWGRDKMEMMFGEDLGWTSKFLFLSSACPCECGETKADDDYCLVCWNYMQLGLDPNERVKKL